MKEYRRRNVLAVSSASSGAAHALELLEPRSLLSVYYVAPSGSDAAAGTRATAPFRTLQHAANVVRPGDTVHVAAGTYAQGFYLNNKVGSARITFLADPGATVDHVAPGPNFSETSPWTDEPEPARPPALTELIGNAIGNRVLLVKPEYWIGADSSCPISRPDDPFCEPRHARIYRGSKAAAIQCSPSSIPRRT